MALGLDEGSAMTRKAAGKRAKRGGNGVRAEGASRRSTIQSTPHIVDVRLEGRKCQPSRRRIFLGSRYEK